MRRARFILVAVCLAAVAWPRTAQLASADSVQEKLSKARSDHEAAQQAVSQAEAEVDRLQAAYARLRADLEDAAARVVTGYLSQESLSEQLASAQERLNARVTAAYEFGPAASIELFLGSASPGDFASAQLFATSTFGVDEDSVAEVAGLKAALADATAKLEARQQRLSSSIERTMDLTAQTQARLAEAQKAARVAGLEVTRLEEEERALAEARAAAAKALGEYLGSGGIGVGCSSGPVHDLIVEEFTPLGKAEVDTALAVATRESNCRPDAYNPQYVPPYGNASGVFQILDPGIWDAWSTRCGLKGKSPFDAEANVAVAACVVADQGWWPWGF